MESLLEGSAEQLIHKAMEMALGGDIAALRLCLERILPPRRDRLVELDLPPTGTANQISTALETLVRSIGEGQITPAEGGMISTILTNKLNALHAEVIEGRIERLEGMMQSERSTDPQT